jgi:hypothetical protein
VRVLAWFVTMCRERPVRLFVWEMPVMMCHLARPVARVLVAAILPGSIAFVLLSSAVSLARGADSGISAGTADLAADTGTPSGPAATAPIQEDRARHAAFDPLAARLKYLHDRLRITPAQEPLWANLAQVMRENANAMALLLKERFQTLKSGNAIDSMSTYEKLSEAQLDGLKRFTAAFQALYNSLSDDQKKIADDIFRLGLLRTVGSIPQVPGQLVTPAPYASFPSSPTVPAYPAYPYYPPPYSYYSYENSLLLSPFIGLGPSFSHSVRRLASVFRLFGWVFHLFARVFRLFGWVSRLFGWVSHLFAWAFRPVEPP